MQQLNDEQKQLVDTASSEGREFKIELHVYDITTYELIAVIKNEYIYEFTYSNSIGDGNGAFSTGSTIAGQITCKLLADNEKVQALISNRNYWIYPIVKISNDDGDYKNSGVTLALYSIDADTVNYDGLYITFDAYDCMMELDSYTVSIEDILLATSNLIYKLYGMTTYNNLKYDDRIKIANVAFLINLNAYLYAKTGVEIEGIPYLTEVTDKDKLNVDNFSYRPTNDRVFCFLGTISNSDPYKTLYKSNYKNKTVTYRELLSFVGTFLGGNFTIVNTFKKTVRLVESYKRKFFDKYVVPKGKLGNLTLAPDKIYDYTITSNKEVYLAFSTINYTVTNADSSGIAVSDNEEEKTYTEDYFPLTGTPINLEVNTADYIVNNYAEPNSDTTLSAQHIAYQGLSSIYGSNYYSTGRELDDFELLGLEYFPIEFSTYDYPYVELGDSISTKLPLYYTEDSEQTKVDINFFVYNISRTFSNGGILTTIISAAPSQDSTTTISSSSSSSSSSSNYSVFTKYSSGLVPAPNENNNKLYSLRGNATWAANETLTFTGASTGTYDGSSALTIDIPTGGNAVEWGKISGTIANQTDLQDELDNKQEKMSPIDTTNIFVF